MTKSPVIELLERKDRRQQKSQALVDLIAANPSAFPELMFGLWHVEGYVRERAADAIEEITKEHPRYLQPFKAELLGVMAEARPASVRWHLAQMAPRLTLNKKERLQVLGVLRGYLRDRSSIVKSYAMDALVQITRPDAALFAETMEVIRASTETGTPAMRAQGRMLLKHLVREQGLTGKELL